MVLSGLEWSLRGCNGSDNGFVEDAIGWEANEYSIWVCFWGWGLGRGLGGLAVGIVN